MAEPSGGGTNMKPLPLRDAHEAPPTFTGRPSWPNGLAIAVLVTITLVFYHGLWWPGLVLIHRAAPPLYLPIKQHLTDRLSSGAFPQCFPSDPLARTF